MTTITSGTLWLVPTPIGNRQDWSPRAIAVLKQCPWVAAEDTRHSKPLLTDHGIVPQWLSLHAHNEQSRCDALIARLEAGEDVAIISDAGTPGISDPGARLVSRAHDHGIRIVSVPGPCAVTSAVAASGFTTSLEPGFLFLGFLPPKTIAKMKRLEQYAQTPQALACFESPRRLVDTLACIVEVLGPQKPVLLAREISKCHETIVRRPAAALLAWVQADPNQQRGECVLVIEGCSTPQQPRDREAQLLKAMVKHMPTKEACQIVSDYTGYGKNALRSILYDDMLKSEPLID